METGVGQARTERPLTWLLGSPKLGNLTYRPKFVVAAGFCGALQDDLRTGDVILATEVVAAATGECWPTTWPGELPPGRWEPPLHRGRFVTVPTLAATAEQKQKLGNQWHASRLKWRPQRWPGCANRPMCLSAVCGSSLMRLRRRYLPGC